MFKSVSSYISQYYILYKDYNTLRISLLVLYTFTFCSTFLWEPKASIPFFPMLVWILYHFSNAHWTIISVQDITKYEEGEEPKDFHAVVSAVNRNLTILGERAVNLNTSIFFFLLISLFTLLIRVYGYYY